MYLDLKISLTFMLSFSSLTLSLYIYIYIFLATLVKGNPKAPFSIATTPRCRGGR